MRQASPSWVAAGVCGGPGIPRLPSRSCTLGRMPWFGSMSPRRSRPTGSPVARSQSSACDRASPWNGRLRGSGDGHPRGLPGQAVAAPDGRFYWPSRPTRLARKRGAHARRPSPGVRDERRYVPRGCHIRANRSMRMPSIASMSHFTCSSDISMGDLDIPAHGEGSRCRAL